MVNCCDCCDSYWSAAIEQSIFFRTHIRVPNETEAIHAIRSYKELSLAQLRAFCECVGSEVMRRRARLRVVVADDMGAAARIETPLK